MTEGRIRRLRERWNAFRPTRAGSFWAAVYTAGGAIALGFTVGGWMTPGAAQELADKAAAKARAQLTSTLCVQRFLAAPDAEARLADLKAIDLGYHRRQFVAEGGWALMPGEESTSSQAAGLCAAALYRHAGVVASGAGKAEG